MNASRCLRAAVIGLVALVSTGCVDTGYREGPRVYRDDYDRGYWRPGYLQRDPRRYRDERYRRFHRDTRYGDRDRDRYRDRFDARPSRDRGSVDRIGSPGGDPGMQGRIIFRRAN